MRLVRLILLSTVVLTMLVIVLPLLPLGVPGEWTWNRHPGPDSLVAVIDRLAPALLLAALLFGLAVYGNRHVATAGRLKTSCLVLGLTTLSWLWLGAVQHSAPMAHRQLKPLWVLYDAGSSGYFHEAVFEIDSTGEFLATYEERMQEGDILHVGTHPPGLFLLCRQLIEICDDSPSVVQFVNSMASEDSRSAFRLVEANSRIGQRLTDSELAALQLLSELTTLSVALVVVPLFVLLCHVGDRHSAWQMCCLWSLFPCLAIFLPKSDLLFPLTTTTVLTLGVLSMSSWNRIPLAVAAGFVLWLGLMLSLAHLPVVFLLGIYLVVRTVQTRGRTLRLDAVALALIAGSALAATLIWSAATDCNMVSIWQQNLNNHASFYAQYSRTWWKWLLVNPIELGFAVGLPFFALFIAGGISTIRQLLKAVQSSSDSRHVALSSAILVTIGVLWLSGKNSGEAARLWCFLTPWLLVVAALFIEGMADRDRKNIDGKAIPGTHNRNSLWKHLLVAQLIVAVTTVSSVSGFLF